MVSCIIAKILLGITCLLSCFYIKKTVIFSFFCISVSVLWDVRLQNFSFNYIDLFLGISIALFLCKQIVTAKKFYISHYALILLVFLCWAVITLLLNDMSFIGIKRLLKYVLRYGVYIFFIPMILKTEHDLIAAIRAFAIGGSMIAWGYVAKLVVNPSLLRDIFSNPTRPVIFSFLGWAGHDLGHYMSIIIPFLIGVAINTKGNIFIKRLWWGIPCAIIALGLSFTKSAWLGFFVGLFFLFRYIRKYLSGNVFCVEENMTANCTRSGDISVRIKSIFYFFRKSKKMIIRYILSVFLLFFCLFFMFPRKTQGWLWANFKFQDVSGVTRVRVWKTGLNMIAKNAISGVGFYNFEKNFPLYDIGGILDDKTPTDPHNWWIRIGAETGILGLLIFMLFCYCLIAEINKTVKNLPPEDYEFKIMGIILSSTLISIFVQGFFESSFMWSHFIWALFSLAIIYNRVMKSKINKLTNE